MIGTPNKKNARTSSQISPPNKKTPTKQKPQKKKINQSNRITGYFVSPESPYIDSKHLPALPEQPQEEIQQLMYEDGRAISKDLSKEIKEESEERKDNDEDSIDRLQRLQQEEEGYWTDKEEEKKENDNDQRETSKEMENIERKEDKR